MFRKFKCDHIVFPVINKDGNYDIIFKSKNHKDRQWYYARYRAYALKYCMDKSGPYLKLDFGTYKPVRIVVDKLASRNYMVTEDGTVVNRKNRFVCGLNKTTIGNRSSYSVHINTPDGFKSFKVHRLVAYNFCDRPDKYKHVPYDELVVNHIDGVATNNYYTNLEWCTTADNTQHAYRIGLARILYGEDHNRSKISNKKINFYRKDFYKSGLSVSAYIKKNNIDMSITGFIYILKNQSRFDSKYVPDLEYIEKTADSKGENNVNAKLTMDQVRWLREDKAKNNGRLCDYAKMFNVSDGVIYYTLLNEKYHDPNYIVPDNVKVGSKKVSDEDLKWMREDFIKNKTSVSVYAEKFGMKSKAIRKLINNTYRHDPSLPMYSYTKAFSPDLYNRVHPEAIALVCP